jgi:hypothetical protein
MRLSYEIKFILKGGSPTEIRTHDGKLSPKFLVFLADNELAY